MVAASEAEREWGRFFGTTAPLTPPSAMRHPALPLVCALLLTTLAGCDAAGSDPAPPPGLTVDGARVEAAGLQALPGGAVLAQRRGGAVTVEGGAGTLDAYFDVEIADVGGTLVLDLAGRPGGAPEVRLVQTRTAADRLALHLDGRAWSGGADVEYVADGRVVAQVEHSGDGPLGASDREIESEHIDFDEDGKPIVVYDFSDGEPASVTPEGAASAVPCTEIHVRPRDASRRLPAPVVSLGGAGWETVRFERAVERKLR